MVWVVDKKVVRHLVEHGGKLAEVPVRVSFEYVVEEGSVIAGSLTIKTLYNKKSVCGYFPGIDSDVLEESVQATVTQEIHEHLCMSQLTVPDDARKD